MNAQHVTKTSACLCLVATAKSSPSTAIGQDDWLDADIDGMDCMDSLDCTDSLDITYCRDSMDCTDSGLHGLWTARESMDFLD